MKIENSKRKDKRFVAVFDNGVKVNFGLLGAQTYIDHGDKLKRSNYLARHGNSNEDWTNPYTAGSLSRFLLWGDYITLEQNIKSFKKRFNV